MRQTVSAMPAAADVAAVYIGLPPAMPERVRKRNPAAALSSMKVLLLSLVVGVGDAAGMVPAQTQKQLGAGTCTCCMHCGTGPAS